MFHRMEFRLSGPLQVAEIDCHGCEGSSSLSDPRCRACVLGQLGAEGGADRTVLKRAYHRIYCSPNLSTLALALTGVKQLMSDRTLYAPSEEGKCKRCVSERYERLTELWPRLLHHPHDLSPLGELKGSLGKLGEECSRCTVGHFSKLLKSIEAGVKNRRSKTGGMNWPSYQIKSASVRGCQRLGLDHRLKTGGILSLK